MITNFGKHVSLLTEWMNELRDVDIQTDRLRFRKNLERIGEIMAYEISKKILWNEKEIQTPLGIHNSKTLTQQPVLATILRAGLPLHNGLLNFFDKADNAFISAYRKHKRDGSFEISLEYLSCPSIENRVLIIADPMLATGSSMVAALQSLLHYGTPSEIHVVCAIAATEGIDYIVRELGEKIYIWCGDIDDELTAKGYIVPGLGDAGDLSFGPKSQF
ncbi:MAG TPA: uracil phosphoribosyltransferase [Parafilimonas sp.]|nr:uracil phosphoribosyltransferase [Parafilimonas sp.]